MKIIKSVKQLHKELNRLRKQGKTIGLTPTMGALHKGHISLVNRMMDENDVGVVSIFVNPTQFNEEKDLIKYPRTLKADADLLANNNLDILFAPKREDVYPKNLNTILSFDMRGLDKKMEGEFRPGHFDGVCQVVKRLLDILDPDSIYMGQKDFQQFTIIGHMINALQISAKLVVCDIVREDSGLAMSSRNTRLSSDMRKEAAIIYKTLKWIKRNKNKYSILDLRKKAIEKLTIPGIRPEYVIIANGSKLNSIRKISANDYVVVCVAVWAEEVRLIDNMILKNKTVRQ